MKLTRVVFLALAVLLPASWTVAKAEDATTATERIGSVLPGASADSATASLSSPSMCSEMKPAEQIRGSDRVRRGSPALAASTGNTTAGFVPPAS